MTQGTPEPVLHGGDIDAARRRFPDAPEPWIDLSTGINPHPYPIAEPDPAAWTRLPQDAQERELIDAARRRYIVPIADMIVASPGTQALIQHLPRLLPPGDVTVLGPTYSEHARSWRREGHRVTEAGGLEGAKDAKVVVVVNPNNPTGRVIPKDHLALLAVELGSRGGLLVVDESFADVVPEPISLIPSLPHRTIVLRSFGKMYGLPGLRLGFAIASPDIASRLRDALGPWAVSVPAMVAGAGALRDDGWLDAMRATLTIESRRLESLLRDCGFDSLGSTPLFHLASHPRAGTIADALGRAGLHVRRFPERPDWLRFGLPGTEAAWQRLEYALLNSRAVAL